jgi:3-hydroxybutyryl-CoA dehydrogenase
MEVRNLTVIGAGLMGTGIAHVSALGGIHTTLVDISSEILEKALGKIEGRLQKGIELNKIDREMMEQALSRLKLETDLEKGVREADMVIEAVPEKIELKLEVFRKVDQLCREEVIFASNTSALSITEMAAGTQRPEKCIGMHFFNPVHVMRLVEIVRGLETSNDTYQITKRVAESMGKETVEVKESSGFVTSRINVLIGNEAFYLLQEGVASAEDIDKALKLGLNHPMGPFELVDLVGLDTRLSVLEFLHERLGEKYRPCPLLVKYVKAGRLGRKTGKGVYEYTKKE